MRGIVPSLNTAFLGDGSVDLSSMRRLVHHTVAAGCGGMLGLAVAGEHATLSMDEKLQIIDAVSDANGQRIAFIVSVTAPDMADSIALSQAARAAGAAGICVQMPDGLDRAGMLGFLRELAPHGPDTLMVQDLDWVGGGLSVEDIVFLFENVAQFTWLKIETAQAGAKYSAVLKATGGALNVCGGWAVTQLMDAMARGVHAFIPTGLESIYVEIFDRYHCGDPEAARQLFERVLPILNFSNQHIGTSIRFFKQLRKAEGLFEHDVCRSSEARFDAVQEVEGRHALGLALDLLRRA